MLDIIKILWKAFRIYMFVMYARGGWGLAWDFAKDAYNFYDEWKDTDSESVKAIVEAVKFDEGDITKDESK